MYLLREDKAAEAGGYENVEEKISQQRKTTVLRNDEGYLHGSLGSSEAGFNLLESAVACLG